MAADGNYQFRPAADFNGIATFTYEISDGNASLQQTHFITVSPVNDAPIGTNNSIDATSGEYRALKPEDFGFRDIKDRDILANVIIDLSSLSKPEDLDIGGTLNTKKTGTETISYAQVANGEVLVKSGAISTTLELKFKVQDDQGTANGGQDTDQQWRTLSIFSNPPASNDEEIINQIRVSQILDELKGRIPGETDQIEFINGLKQLASGLSSEKRIEFLENHEEGFYDFDPMEAKKFIKANVSPKNLKSEKSNIESQLQNLDTNDPTNADQIAELQDQIKALEQTLSQVPKTSLFEDLDGIFDPSNPPDPDALKAALMSSGSETLKNAIQTDANGNEVLAIESNGEQVPISMAEYGELMSLRASNEEYQSRLKAGFTLASAEELTEIQTKNAAVAKAGLGVDPTDESFLKIESVFAGLGMTMEQAMSMSDEKVSQLKDLATDSDKAADFDKTYTDLSKMKSPFGGANITPTADDIFFKLNKGDRKVALTNNGMSEAEKAQAEADLRNKVIFSEEADVLGTADLAPTNSQFIGALDGSIEGQDGLTFSADSKIAVFKFRFDQDTKRGQKIVSYLAGGADIYDENGDFTNAADGEVAGASAGLEEGTYDKYLKYVSRYDLEAYGASDTGEVDEDGVPIFSWENETIKTADGEPLTQLTGEIITKEGWYDYTQVTEGGDGARYIFNSFGRIVGVELNFTANMFGDKEPGDNFITDPGATVGTETVGNGKLEEGEVAINEAELQVLRTKAENAVEGEILKDGMIAVKKDAVILKEGQKAVDADAVILEEGQKLINANAVILEDGQFISDIPVIEEANQKPQEEVTDRSRIGLGTDAPGNSFSDPQFTGQGDGMSDQLVAMTLGEGPGQSDSTGDGQSSSSGSGEGDGESALAQEVNEFIQGDGDGGFEDEEARGQGAQGQGEGSGGEAALGEDQTPETQRKRGLMLQPLMAVDDADDANKTPSSLLKNLSKGSLMGNNLLDALALGAGVLYALYAPKAVDAGKKGWRKLLNDFRRQVNGGTIPMSEKNVLSVFAMKMPNGSERLMATRIGMEGTEVLAQQDLPSDVQLGTPGSDAQIDYSVTQLLEKLKGQNFDLALIGPKLQNQSALVQELATESQLLNTKSLIKRLNECNSSDIEALQQWLNKPSTTPPESSPVYDLLQENQKRYSNDVPPEQASMSSLVELSIAMGWSQNNKAE